MAAAVSSATHVSCQLSAARHAAASSAATRRALIAVPKTLTCHMSGLSLASKAPRGSRRAMLPRVRAMADEAAVAVAVANEEAPAVPAADVDAGVEAQPQKKKKSMAAPKKQLLLLRFVWLEKNIGIGLDQLVPGQGTVPLSPYMFWPRKDAWEELKALLDEKPWISRKRAIILLNQATDIINLWQQTTYKQ